ncbi:hypothetical protein [Pseudocolwellia sp. HL-MZ7]|uniref:hypothetical protein n=1 Tax=Pseudocolwellia sp. HL-MZ7 TaxID=3400627 RepID=UPI003CF2F601
MKIFSKISVCVFMSLVALGSFNVSADMSVQELNEFNKQYNIAFAQFNNESSALTYMDNPYNVFIKKITGNKSELNDEEKLFFAKRDRFKKCQSILSGFIPIASRSKNFTENGGMTKDEFLASLSKQYDLDYPFSVKDSKDRDKAHRQLFFKKGWEYRGKGEDGIRDFFDTCLNLPVEMYIKTYE